MPAETHGAMRAGIERLFERKPAAYSPADIRLFEDFRHALEEGSIRAAEPDPASPTGWRVNAWVKKGILVGFRIGSIVDMSAGGLSFLDKDTYPAQRFTGADGMRGVRIVPGGSSVRSGAYLGKSVTCMPPMYINVGAYVGDGTMVDSHALVGSCAQVGANCHIS